MRGVFRVVLLLMLTGWSPAVQAQIKPLVTSLSPYDSKSAIFIGNSYFYYSDSLPRQVGLLEKAADPAHKLDYRNVMVAIRGYHLAWHDVDSYFGPNAIGGYLVGYDDNLNLNLNPLDMLFDVAVMMDCSQCPIHPKLKSAFVEYSKRDSTIVRAHGARPVFFMSWAYADRPEMTELLAAAYTAAGNANNALVIPAGLAFARARKRPPAINLYASDYSHPSFAGTYLAACTTYAALTGRSPVGNLYHGGLDEPTAKFLQEIAWDTVQDYYGK